MHEARWVNIDYFLAVLQGFWDLSSLIRDQTCILCSENRESYPLDHQGAPQMVKYFECHSGSLMNQRQTPSQSYLALTVPHVGMC